VLPLGQPIRWREYELTLHPLPGHTRFQAAIEVEVDGRRVLATGDQQHTAGPPIPNYQYRNRFAIDDYVRSAELYRTLRPDLIVSGHWLPQEVDEEFLERVRADGRRVADLHRALLPLDEADFGAEGFAARIEPYRSQVGAGETVELEVEVVATPAEVRLVVPAGWAAEPDRALLEHPGRVTFQVRAGASAVRARVAADVTVDGVRYGQQAEALVDVL
jgi:glyoxylase-like metal-dependent hydrolase (beta-lactamase superfamily II)